MSTVSLPAGSGPGTPVVQGVTLVFAVLVVLINLLADMAYAALDPRVRFD